MNGREDLKARIDGLSEAAIRFVNRMVDSLSSPPTSTIREPDAWISRSSGWIEYFGLALSVHHGTTMDALGLNGFETAFGNACESVGWKVEWAESMTHRFSDLTVTDDLSRIRRLSLKSTAAQKISASCAYLKADRSGLDSRYADCPRTPRANFGAFSGLHGSGRLDHFA